MRSGLRTRRQSPGRRRHVLTTASSASPSCATSATLLERFVMRTLTTRKLYQQILEHFLIWVAKRILFILNDTQMTTIPTIYSSTHHMFAFIHRCPQYSRYKGGMLGGEGRGHLAYGRQGRQGGSRVSVSHRQFGTKSAVLQQARHSGPNIDQAMNERTLSECKLRAQWRTDQHVQRCVRSARLFGKHPQNVDFLSTVFAPVPLAPDPQNTRLALS